MFTGKRKFVAATGAVVLALVTVAQGSAIQFSYSGENRSVTANSSATGVVRGGTTSTPQTNTQNQSQQASSLGDFAGNVSAASSIGPQGAGASGSAVQQSSLGDTSFSASGSVVADSVLGNDPGPVTGSGSSVFDVTFDVPQAESYVFSASLNGSVDPSAPASASVSIQLTDGTGNSVFAPVSTVNVPNLGVQGILQPGEYSFAMSVLASSADENKDFVNYSILLTATPAGSSTVSAPVGPGANAVPLPSSGLTAFAMLSALGLAGIARRRFPGWVRMSMI